MSESDDHIYFNIDKTFSIDSVFSFSETRVKPVLKNPKEYELCVSRFSIPAIAIPINFQIPNKYLLSLEYNGTRIDRYMDYVNNTNYPPYYKPYFAIWYYSEISEAISTTLKHLHDDMLVAEPTFVPTKACLMDYDPATDRFSIYAQASYANPAIKIIFNEDLAELFSFQTFQQPTLTNKSEYVILIKNNFNNSNTYGGGGYTMTQEYSTSGLWNTARSILIETNSIPVNADLLGQTQKNVFRQIITDFNIDRSSRSDRSTIQYFPQGTPQRWIDLNSSYELRRIDIAVAWEDVNGNVYPIYSLAENPISLKIQFRKKMTGRLEDATEDF